MSEKDPQEPISWGLDEFTSFLNAVRQNQFASFVNKPAVKKLIEIDRIFSDAGKNWRDPKPIVLSALLFRSHSAYRAAFGLAMAGQVLESYGPMRLCLECAAYSLHISDNEDRALIWLRRDDSKKHKQKATDEFKRSNLRDSIKRTGNLGSTIYQTLYDRCIDIGGHPNPLGVFGSQRRIVVDNATSLNNIFLHGDDINLDLALKTIGQVGILGIYAFQQIYPERFIAIGINHRILRMREEFLSSK